MRNVRYRGMEGHRTSRMMQRWEKTSSACMLLFVGVLEMSATLVMKLE